MITSTMVYLRAMYINCYCESSYSELLECRQLVLIDVCLGMNCIHIYCHFSINPEMRTPCYKCFHKFHMR